MSTTTMVNTSGNFDTAEATQADTIRETMSVNNLLMAGDAPDVTSNPPALAPPSTPTRSVMKEEIASPDTVMSDPVSKLPPQGASSPTMRTITDLRSRYSPSLMMSLSPPLMTSRTRSVSSSASTTSTLAVSPASTPSISHARSSRTTLAATRLALAISLTGPCSVASTTSARLTTSPSGSFARSTSFFVSSTSSRRTSPVQPTTS
jgi:hypothetical protein